MRKLILLALLCGSASAATICSQRDTNSGTIILSCTGAPAGATVEFTKEEASPGVPDFSRLHPSVDPALYPGSNLCSYTGNLQTDADTCKFVLGRYGRASISLDGRAYTQSLQVDQLYYVRVTGVSSWTGTVSSGHLYSGRAYLPFVVQRDVTGVEMPGHYAYPTPSYTTDSSVRNKFTGPELIDPLFTTALRRVTGPGQITGTPVTTNFGTAFSVGSGSWSTPLAAISNTDAGAVASFSTDGTNLPSLVMELPDLTSGAYGFNIPDALNASDSGPLASLDYVQVAVTAQITGCSGTPDCTMQVGISQDSGNTLVSDWKDLIFTPLMTTVVGSDTQPVLNYWKSSEPLIMPRELLGRSGTVTADTTASKLTWTSGGEFNVNSLKQGARLYLKAGAGGTEFYCTVSALGVDPADGTQVGYSSCTGAALTNGSSYSYSLRTASIVLRPKTATAGRTFNVAFAEMTYQRSELPQITSANGDWVCSDEVTGDTGEYICLLTVGNLQRAFAIHPGATGGSRFLGNINSPAFRQVPSVGAGNYWGNPAGCTAVFWKSNPKKFWCSHNGGDLTATDGSLSILVGEITGPFSEHAEAVTETKTIGDTPCTDPDEFHQICANVKWSTYTPVSIGKGFATQLTAFTAAYPIPWKWGSWYGFGLESGTDGVNEFLPVFLRQGQNRMGYYAVFTNGDDDPSHSGTATGPRIIAATPTHAGGQIRWGSIHTAGGFINFPWLGYSSVGLVCNQSTIGCGPFWRQSVAGFTMPGNSSDIVIPLQSSPAFPTDPNPVIGGPVSDANNGTPGVLGDVAVGDSVCFSNTTDMPGQPEVGRIKQITDSTHWVIERGQSHNYPPPISHGDGVNPIYLFMCGARDIVRDGNLVPIVDSVYWNPFTNPNGQGNTSADSLGDSNTGGGHGFTSGNIIAAAGGEMGVPYPGFAYWNYYEFRSGTSMYDVINKPKVWVNRNPVFAGKPGSNLGNTFGTHLGQPGIKAPVKVIHASDAQSLYGSEFAFNKVSAAGCLWTALPTGPQGTDDYSYNPSGTYRLNRKHFSTMASASNRPLADVSSTTKMYTTDCASDLWTYGIARNDGELFAGSVRGQIFVKAAYITTYSAPNQTSCPADPHGTVDDWASNPMRTICFANNSTAANSVQDIDFSKMYLDGQGMRGLSGMFSHIRNVSGFWKANLYPRGEWLAAGTSNAGQRNDVWSVRVPNMPGVSALNFTTFVGLKLGIPAVSGAVKARVKFGYDLFGLPTDGYCTSRKEACYAVNSTVNEVNPFLFAGDLQAGSGVPCAGGCEITLPTPSGMTPYYTVQYFDATGTLILTMGMDVASAQ